MKFGRRDYSSRRARLFTKRIPFLRSQNIHFDGLRIRNVARITSEASSPRNYLVPM